MKGNNSNLRMSSDTIWGIVLLLILFIILACVFGFTCKNRRNIRLVNKSVQENMTNNEESEEVHGENMENLENNNQEEMELHQEEIHESFNNPGEPNYYDPDWKNNRYFNFNNVSKLQPTDPIHVRNQTINTVLMDHNDLHSEELENYNSKFSLKKKPQ